HRCSRRTSPKRNRRDPPGRLAGWCGLRLVRAKTLNAAMYTKMEIVGKCEASTAPVSRLSTEVAVAENLRGEGAQLGAVLPRVKRKSSLTAGLLKEGSAVPAVFNRNLREQEATASMQLDQQSVPADLNLSRDDRAKWRQHAQRDSKLGEFLNRERPEPGVFESRGSRRISHCPIQRSNRQRISDATSQSLTNVDCRKHAARFGEVLAWNGK